MATNVTNMCESKYCSNPAVYDGYCSKHLGHTHVGPPVHDKPIVRVNAPNPKKAYGDKKPALGQLPLVGMVAQATAHMDGDYKYGFRNWRNQPVEAMTYIHAIVRHAMLWSEGEEHARDTGVNNLGAVMACCAILLDAQANGALIDNRSHSQPAADALHDAEALVERLKAAQAERDKAKQ